MERLDPKHSHSALGDVLVASPTLHAVVNGATLHVVVNGADAHVPHRDPDPDPDPDPILDPDQAMRRTPVHEPTRRIVTHSMSRRNPIYIYKCICISAAGA